MAYLTSVSLGLFLLVSSPSVNPTQAGDRPEVSAGTVVTLAAPVHVESRLGRGYVVLPATLGREGLDEGFTGVSISVSQCVNRHLKREGESPARRVEVNLIVRRDGKVSRMRLPRRVRRTVFGACMKAHSSRWRFPPFTGKPIRVKKRFILN